MLKKFIGLILSIFLLANIGGCVVLLAGVAGGIGTATWLSGKLSQEVNSSFEESVRAVRPAFRALRLEVTKETHGEETAQFIGKYSDGRTIWVDIHRVFDMASRIEVRVGVAGDKEAARKILSMILRYL